MEAAPTAPSLDVPASEAPLSKSQQRKQRKRALEQHRKADRKQRQARAAEERARQRDAEWAALSLEEQAARQHRAAEARAMRLKHREEAQERWLDAYREGPRVVIDMDFEEKMEDGEIRSLCQQIMFCWSVIKRAPRPIQLSLCGLQPGSKTHALLMGKAGADQWQLPMTEARFPQQAADAASIVYLTADSPNVLRTLDRDKVYVIGGIVDHNRHKALTLSVAIAHGCSHAKLPLAEFLDLAQNAGRFSKVLTVNHIVDVLTKFHETSDWKASFLHAIPARKNVAPPPPADPHSSDSSQPSNGADADPEPDATGAKTLHPEPDGPPVVTAD